MTGPGGGDLPHDIAAERKVLSAMLDHPSAIDVAAEMLVPEDFFRPGHQVAFRAMAVMRACGEFVAVETVRDWICREGDQASMGGPKAGEYLFSLWELHIPALAAASFAGIVADRATRRRWILASQRIVQLAAGSGDLDDMAAACVAEADAASVVAGDVVRSTRLTGAAEFMAGAGSKPPEVIPGVINRMDRVLVCASGGSGKTVLGLQHLMAGCVGIHPFGNDRFDPVRGLWIDLEMPDYLGKANLELVHRTARYYGDPDKGGRFQMLRRPRGINLADRGDAHLMAGLIRKAAPDFIVAGPVYKMHQDRGERGDHTAVMDFWDEMRDRHGFALWLETHPAKEGGRFGGGNAKKPTPGGSGRWSDWAEIGFGMVRGKTEHLWDVVPFRGQRDRSRVWPDQFTVNVGGGWPWQANYPPGTFGGMG